MTTLSQERITNLVRLMAICALVFQLSFNVEALLAITLTCAGILIMVLVAGSMLRYVPATVRRFRPGTGIIPKGISTDLSTGILALLPAVSAVLTTRGNSTISWLTILLYQLTWWIATYPKTLTTTKVFFIDLVRLITGKVNKTKALAHVQSFRLFINGIKN
jgi:hypothetical protein